MKKVSDIRPSMNDIASGSENGSELDSIKSILFGSYAREFDRRLQLLEESQDRKFKEQDAALDDLANCAANLQDEKLDREYVASLLMEFSDRLSKKS